MYLTKIDPEFKQFRFYRMVILRGLLGNWGLVREWGRICGNGRSRTDWFETESAAKDPRFTLHVVKAKCGYQSGSRDSVYRRNPLES